MRSQSSSTTLDYISLRAAVIRYEAKSFFEITRLDRERPANRLHFTATGRYQEVLTHIHGHKYYINQSRVDEIPLEEAAVSWHDNVFLPVVEGVERERALARFPGRTAADLYVWMVKHWDDLKRKYGEQYTIGATVADYSARYGRGVWRLLAAWTLRAWQTLRRGR